MLVLNNDNWSQRKRFTYSHFSTDVVMEALGDRDGIKLNIIELWTGRPRHYISIMIIIIVQLVHSIGRG